MAVLDDTRTATYRAAHGQRKRASRRRRRPRCRSIALDDCGECGALARAPLVDDCARQRSRSSRCAASAGPLMAAWGRAGWARRATVGVSSMLGGIMEPVVLLDAAGRRRSAATMPGHRRGQPPRNKGMRYPADPPTVEEIVLVMRHAGDRPHGLRLRGLIVVMWRAGLRISETLALTESDLDADRGAILVRHGKGDKRREVGMDQWGWELLRPWLAYRVQIPVGPLFCVIDGRTRGRPLTTTSVRQQLRRTAAKAGVRRRFAPHQLRHAHARRDGPRGRAAERHPAPARTRQPRDHVRLPTYRASTTPRSSTPSTRDAHR